MERLTNEAWRNFDPWECCGQDEYCQRGCHDPGGCTKGCIVPRLYARLGAYEDTGLEPEKVLPKDKADEIALKLMRLADLESICGYTRLRELAKADKEGRVAVLPCEAGGLMLDMIDIERPRIMKGLHFVVAYESTRGTIFYIPYDVFREYIDAGHVYPLHKLKEAQNGKSKLD